MKLNIDQIIDAGDVQLLADRLNAFERVEENCNALKRLLPELAHLARTEPRTSDFKLWRKDSVEPKLPEAALERMLWARYGSTPESDFVTSCPRIISYQVPLKKIAKQAWGKIDLLGCTSDGEPVPIELKRHDSTETLLRAIVEVFVYRVRLDAARDARGSRFQIEWDDALRRHGIRLTQSNAAKPRSALCVAGDYFWRRQWRLHQQSPELAEALGGLLEQIQREFEITIEFVNVDEALTARQCSFRS